MAYRILTVVEKRQNDSSTYQWLKVPDEKGKSQVYETDSEPELEDKVKEMLSGNYSMSDLVVVQPLDYTVEVDITT